MPTEYKHVFQLRPDVLDHFGGAKIDLLGTTFQRFSTLIRLILKELNEVNLQKFIYLEYFVNCILT